MCRMHKITVSMATGEITCRVKARKRKQTSFFLTYSPGDNWKWNQTFSCIYSYKYRHGASISKTMWAYILNRRSRSRKCIYHASVTIFTAKSALTAVIPNSHYSLSQSHQTDTPVTGRSSYHKRMRLFPKGLCPTDGSTVDCNSLKI